MTHFHSTHVAYQARLFSKKVSYTIRFLSQQIDLHSTLESTYNVRVHNGVLLIAGSSLPFTQSKNVTYCATLVVQYKYVKQRHITTILFFANVCFRRHNGSSLSFIFPKTKVTLYQTASIEGYCYLTQFFMTLFFIRLTAFTFIDSQFDSEHH